MTNASIALNARFSVHRPTGMQRYGLELARRFGDQIQVVRPVRALRGPAGHLWEQVYLPSTLHGRLLWSPNNTGPLAVRRQVCTMHDLIPLDQPEWFSPRFAAWYKWLLPRLAKQVRHIIAVSEFTKRRVVELLAVPQEKVTVIPNGVDDRFSPRPEEEILCMRRSLGITCPAYLLYVGNLEPRKNVRRLLQAWTIAQRSVPPEIERELKEVPWSLKRVPSARSRTGSSSRAMLPIISSRRFTRARLLYFIPLSMNASACRRWRPWPAVRL
jgi:glycosyltransferase involved in cell wall biosynthesis